MGMQTGQTGSVNSEPNLVPMIDVLLVLLVIFMLMVPLYRKVIEVHLPERIAMELPSPSSPIVLEVVPGDDYRINTRSVPRARLNDRLHEIFDQRPEKILYVKGDPSLKWQEVMSAMDIARGAGVKVIGIPPEPNRGG